MDSPSRKVQGQPASRKRPRSDAPSIAAADTQGVPPSQQTTQKQKKQALANDAPAPAASKPAAGAKSEPFDLDALFGDLSSQKTAAVAAAAESERKKKVRQLGSVEPGVVLEHRLFPEIVSTRPLRDFLNHTEQSR
jgi:hypothetical protein